MNKVVSEYALRRALERIDEAASLLISRYAHCTGPRGLIG